MRWFVWFCVMMLSFTSVIHVEGFQSPPWDDVCSPNAPESVVERIGRNVISQVCGDYNQCLETMPFEDRYTCNVPLYLNVLETCTGDEAYCKTYAALMTAAIVQGEDDGDPLTMISRLAIDPIQDSALLEMFSQFYQTDIQANVIYYPYDPTIHLAAGAALEFQGEFETALEAYSLGVSRSDNPLLAFRRGQLYGILGNTDLAAMDGIYLNYVAESVANTNQIASMLSEQYPLDQSLLEDWLVYPDQSFSVGPGGDLLRDLSLRSPSAIQLGIYEDGQVLLIMEEDFYGNIAPYIYRLIDENTYRNSSAGRSRLLRLEGGTGVRTQNFEGFEAGGNDRQWLAQADLSDPRPNYDRCEGGARWRLMIGSQGGAPEGMRQTPFLYDRPNGNQVSRLYDFEVVGAPICVENVAWWEVRELNALADTDPTYWIPEAFPDVENSFIYEVEIRGHNNVDCPTALQQNLSPSPLFQAYVAPEVDSVTVHDEPASTGEIIATMHTREAFFVLDGPVCEEGNLWWRVDYNGVIGWFRADDGERYFATNFLPLDE